MARRYERSPLNDRSISGSTLFCGPPPPADLARHRAHRGRQHLRDQFAAARSRLPARPYRTFATAFQTLDDASGEEAYLFVLEDLAAARVIGTSGIAASAGFHDRFYSYRNEFAVHTSEALGESNRIHTLHLCHDPTGYTLLTSFYIEPGSCRHRRCACRARLLFISEFASRFCRPRRG